MCLFCNFSQWNLWCLKLCWHFDILLKFWYLGKIARFSANVFCPQDFDIYENLGKILLQISPRFLRSFWPLRFLDLVELSARISASFWTPRFQDLVGISTRISGFMAAEILRYRRDLGKISARISERFWPARSPRSRWPKTHWDLAEISRSKCCRGITAVTYCYRDNQVWLVDI